jgi:hypothetical protein
VAKTGRRDFHWAGYVRDGPRLFFARLVVFMRRVTGVEWPMRLSCFLKIRDAAEGPLMRPYLELVWDCQTGQWTELLGLSACIIFRRQLVGVSGLFRLICRIVLADGFVNIRVCGCNRSFGDKSNT